MIPAFSFLAGLIFGTGLCLSGMIQQSKVLGFLDLAGRWDPSLAFVMGGAISVGLVVFSIVGRQTAALPENASDISLKREIDRRLVTGSLIFGVGWGLSGICPGPGIALLAFGSPQAITFVVAMLAGMLIFELTGQFWVATTQDRAIEDC
jgi:uncharacterized membrane protein YedE/YeeE